MNIPKHVAVIPDGNRRWARAKNLPVYEGHRYSAENIFPQVIEACGDAGVEYLTFWVLSTENEKKRSTMENSYLKNLMKYFLAERLDEFHKKNVRLKMIGDLSIFSEDLRMLIENAVEKTANNTKITVLFGINYGGRDELLRAIKLCSAEHITEEITPDVFASYLDTAGIPDPDLIIRTGGEKRLSGFFPWQAEYAELEFLDVLFPEYTKEMCTQSLKQYSQIDRRFGK